MICAPPETHRYHGASELCDRLYFLNACSPQTEPAYRRAQANARIWQAAFDSVTSRQLEAMDWETVRLLIFAYEEATR